MTSEPVYIIDTGVANIASMRTALRRLGWTSALTTDAGLVLRARRVVLPGVGSYASAMSRLCQTRLIEPLRDRINQGIPTLAVCLGMQLFAQSSEESPGVDGLGVWPVQCRRFSAEVVTPQLGFNAVTPLAPGMVEPGQAYFANSYRIIDAPPGWSIATSRYGLPFVSAAWSHHTLACQFHPELSGQWGRTLLQRWLTNDIAESIDAPCDNADADANANDVETAPLLLTGGPRTRLIPCLDIRAGRVVKGVRFQSLRDSGDPAARARLYEAQGADELVLLDVTATNDNRSATLDTVSNVRSALSIPLTVGGGVRSVQDAGALLHAGADKISVNTAAVQRPALISELSQRLGAQSVVIAIDAARRHGGWSVLTHAGAQREPMDAVAWARCAVALGAGEVLLTSWDQDGSRSGYDLELIAAIASAVDAPVIASGGASGMEHMRQAIQAGANAVLAASIFHDGDTTVSEIKRQLFESGIEAPR